MNKAMNTLHTTLLDELRSAGASKHEAIELAALADQLGQLSLQTSKSSLPVAEAKPSIWTRLRPLALPTSIMAVLAIAVFGFAQQSLPGSLLYPAKQISEKSIALVDHNYQRTMMMRRAQEVKDLIGRHADSKLVLATLADYKDDVWTYNIHDAKVSSYCRNRLREAAAAASPVEKKAINVTLDSLRNKA